MFARNWYHDIKCLENQYHVNDKNYINIVEARKFIAVIKFPIVPVECITNNLHVFAFNENDVAIRKSSTKTSYKWKAEMKYQIKITIVEVSEWNEPNNVPYNFLINLSFTFFFRWWHRMQTFFFSETLCQKLSTCWTVNSIVPSLGTDSFLRLIIFVYKNIPYRRTAFILGRHLRKV